MPLFQFFSQRSNYIFLLTALYTVVLTCDINSFAVATPDVLVQDDIRMFTDEQALALAEELNTQVIEFFQAGRYEEAIVLAERVLKLKEQVLGPDHPNTAASLNILAALHQAMGRYEEAETFYQRTLVIVEKQLGSDHPNTITSLNNLAVLYEAMGRYREAESLFQQTLVIRGQQLGPNHLDTAASLNNLAALYRSLGGVIKCCGMGVSKSF